MKRLFAICIEALMRNFKELRGKYVYQLVLKKYRENYTRNIFKTSFLCTRVQLNGLSKVASMAYIRLTISIQVSVW